MRKQKLQLFWVVFLLLIIWVSPLKAKEDAYPKGIPPIKATDYIHAVIEAGRTIYSEVIVERLGFTIGLKATENWQQENTLPLPAQFLLLSSTTTAQKDIGLKYRLMSLWAINDKNLPNNTFEKSGLEEMLKNPEKPFARTFTTGGQSFFEAIYPDMAVTKTCVSCHNNHPKSPKKDFKLGDVMGGISIMVPLDENQKIEGTDNYLISPEVVADYIHSVLDSDRQIYSTKIVNRLQNKNIVFASEHWWESDALPLPAQFLLNTSELIDYKKLDLNFKLISLWPIKPHNGPANEFERTGLTHVSRNPLSPYIGRAMVGGKHYFRAVYPDFAVSESCVSCHNSHPNSPKRDFKLNDVMGGITLSISLH
jgi:hypothetical protein